MAATAPARVVVADDSALMRNIVATLLVRAGVEVVGSAGNGDEALALCERERPDAMTLDLTMPGLDGLGVLRALRAQGRDSVPVVVVSAFSPAHGARAVDALAEGAFDLVAKPAASEGLEVFREALATKVRLAAESRRRQRNSAAAPRSVRRMPAPSRVGKDAKVILIATSTGGPRALAALVPELPSPIGIGTLIVQHMPAGFTGSLAARLNRSSFLNVREATGGERLEPHTALLAPGGRHLRLSRDGRTAITEEPAVGGLRPRADLLIEDAARVYGERLLLVVMTGMGNDGLQGASVVRTHGGQVLVEAQETCTVYGMPRAIVDRGLADEVLPLGQLAAAITEATA